MILLQAPPPPLSWSAPARAGEASRIPQLELALGAGGRAAAVWRARGRVVASTRAGAARALRAPVTVSAGAAGSTSGPRVAVGADGRVAIAWIRSASRLEAATGSAASGRFAPPLSVASGVGGGHDVAVGPDGTALAAWTGRGALLSSALPPGAGAWRSPLTFAPGGDRVALGVDGAGRATAVFRAPVAPFRATVAAATLAPGGAAWDPPADLSPPPRAGSTVGPGFPELGVSSGGRAVAVWSDVLAQGEPQVVRAATRPAPAGPWDPAQTISPPARNAFAPSAGADAGGGAVAVWTQAVSGGPRTAPFSAAFRAGAWRPPGALVATTPRATGARIAVNAAGNALAAWTQPRGGRRVVAAAVRTTANGAWRGPWVLSRPPGGPLAVEPQVALGDDGRGLVVWTQGSSSRTGMAVWSARLTWPGGRSG